MYEYKAQVVRIIDGDTVRFKVDLGYYMSAEVNHRLAEIDTPELRDKDPEVKRAAYAAKDYIAELLPVGSWVTIQTKKRAGSFGRWIATIITEDGLNVNDELVKTGHAVPKKY